ncbi:MAG: hypothetical protein QOI51_928 [Nocardioidaceae bacterium]|jgi:hypothetical protein|nr:hypothetical protein [Nocardioidaceae bacterium]MDX6308615.1 hypothetical protein [Nocardioidaceae bacterium]
MTHGKTASWTRSACLEVVTGLVGASHKHRPECAKQTHGKHIGQPLWIS